MQPIRWDNVNGQSLADASRPLEAAGRSVNTGFDVLGQLLKHGTDINDANWQTGKVNNTNEALNTVMGYDSPEALAAAQKSGAIQSLLTAHGAQMDQAAVRQAADARMGILQQRAEQAISYNHAITDEKTAPILDKARAAALSGNKEAFDILTQQYTAAGGRDLAGVLTYDDQRRRDLVLRGQTDQKSAMDLRLGESTIAHNASDNAYHAGMLTLEGQRNALARDQYNLSAEDHLTQRKAQLRQELGSLYALDPRSAEGTQKIFDEIGKNIKDPNDAANARRTALEAIKQPGVTTGDVIASVLGMDTTHWYKPDAFARWGASDAAKTFGASASSADQRAVTETRKGLVAQDLNRLDTQLAKFQGKTGGTPGTPVSTPAAITNFSTPADAIALQSIARESARVQAQPGSYGPNGFVPAAGAGAATPAATGRVYGDIPSQPAPKIWVGNNFVTNPEFQDWVNKYQQEVDIRNAAFAKRMEQASSRS